MVSTRTVVVVVLALVFGLSSAVLVHLAITGAPDPDLKDTREIVVARETIPLRGKVDASQLEMKEFPAHSVPPNAIFNIEDALERVTLTAIHEGEPLLEPKLAKKGGSGGLTDIIPAGHRGYAVRVVDPAAVLDGLILPGCKVDVLFQAQAKRGTEEEAKPAFSRLLLQNVEVLAVGQHMEAQEENRVDSRRLRSVTLLVEPRQASKLQLAQSLGTLHLSLRPADQQNEIVEAEPVTESEIRGEVASDAAPMREQLQETDVKRMIETYLQDNMPATRHFDPLDPGSNGRKLEKKDFTYVRETRGHRTIYRKVYAPSRKEREK